jgi:16S rRNA (cytosine967-C5)-methyltransferase
MSISPARTAAFDILLRVDRTDAYAAELLHAPQYSDVSLADHGLATEIVMGVLRWRSMLDSRITACSSQKLEKLDAEVLVALRMAAYQLGFLSRVPARAAIHESVELVKRARKRSAAAFVNAVLRKLAAQENSKVPDIADVANSSELAAHSAHPAWLVERWAQEYGLDKAKQICEHNQSIPESAVRFSDPEVETDLAKGGIELSPGRLLTSARRVKSGDITRTPAFREGRVAIQDEGSQLVALLVGKGKNILDGCAAPGGKTRVIAERNPQSSIVAVELHAHRARLLRKLVPAENVEIVTADLCELPVKDAFDGVLADVPCSGTGTLAHNPEIKWRLRPEDLANLHSRQLPILQAAMRHVAPGGRLVYSTCSLEREENSDVVTEALAADDSFHLAHCKAVLERLQVEGEISWSDPDSLLEGPYLRTLPGVHPCDGFFAAILKKN